MQAAGNPAGELLRIGDIECPEVFLAACNLIGAVGILLAQERGLSLADIGLYSRMFSIVAAVMDSRRVGWLTAWDVSRSHCGRSG